MIRRSFRRGLALGLLGGAVMTALRLVQSRREGVVPAAPGPAEWPPIPQTTPAAPERRAPGTEVRTGTDAVEHFADASRQVERPLSDWEPTAPLPGAEETTPLTPPAVADAPAPAGKTKKATARKAPARKAPARKAPAAKVPPPPPLAPWVEPVAGEVPATHPVKAKLASNLYHVPGGFNYARTRPDRCYLDVASAEADGFRPSKR